MYLQEAEIINFYNYSNPGITVSGSGRLYCEGNISAAVGLALRVA
jgi:hypothetical protein